MSQQLSVAGHNALNAVKNLPLAEQATVLSFLSAHLAAEIAQKVSTAGSEQLGRASSEIVQGIETASHGFKQVTAPDGTAGIEVTITRPNGEEVKILLSEGAIGKLHRELADYGNKELNGATPLPREDFEAVVDRLFQAIQGLKVVDGVLGTNDAVLQRAYEIVTAGVRRAYGFSWAVFDVAGGGAVVGRRVIAHALYWPGGADNEEKESALFVASPDDGMHLVVVVDPFTLW